MAINRNLVRHSIQLILWLVAGGLIWLSFRQVSLPELLATLQLIEWWQYILFILANGLVLLFKYLRWWMILRYQQYKIPFLALAGIRQAAFAVSTITPGPQFGGEPVQILALTHHYQVPSAQATASVLLDRTIELTVSFSFIITGALLVLAQHQLGLSPFALGIVGLGLVTPLGYLMCLRFKRRPLSYLLRPFSKLHTLIASSEQEMSRFLGQGNGRLTILLLLSFIGFIAQIGEYWLILHILDVPLQLMRFITLFTVVRLSLFIPTPAGLGAVESGQVLAFSLLGLQLTSAVSVTILMRIRDVLLILIGLWMAAKIGNIKKAEEPNAC